MDFEKEIHQITDMIPEGISLAPETTKIAIEALETVNYKYGPDSDRPLPFHNAPHSVGVTRRSVRMTNMLLPYLRPEHAVHAFDLNLIIGSTHDVDQDSGPGLNEDNSVADAIERIEAEDGELNTIIFKKRTGLGLAATKVDRQEDGELVQANLQKGSHDPIKFIMAFSDINGIAMEGSKRMWRDATNLYYEISPDPSVEGHANFIIDQAGFLSQRLNDPRVKADIAYFFPDDINDVYNDMHKAFHKKIKAAHNLAVFASKHPELQSLIGAAAKGVDQTRLGAVLGKMLTKKAAADQ